MNQSNDDTKATTMPRKMTKTVVTLGGDSFETILPSGLVAPYTQRLNALVQDYTTLTTTTEGDESMADIHEMANLFFSRSVARIVKIKLIIALVDYANNVST